MKKIILLLCFLCCLYARAQTTISVSGVTAGGLSTAITAAGGNLNTVSNLTVSGTIDYRDFLAMRSNMPALASIDLLNTNVAAYGSNPANTIPSQALGNKYLVTNFTFPSSITSIQADAFSQCNGLISLNIPNSVTTIEKYAFLGCTGLTAVSLSNSLTSIGLETFHGCGRLTSLIIPNSVTTIGIRAFKGCSRLTSLTIPNSVLTIGNSAFSTCYGLTSLTISNAVTTIGYGAFENCYGLTAIYADSPTPIDLSSTLDVFIGVDVTTCVLNVPSCSVTAYGTANQWQDFVNIAPIPTPAPTGLNVQVYANPATLANLAVTGNAIQWYAASSGGSALATSTALVDGTTYFASQIVNTCESPRMAVVAKKISESTQTLCAGATVNDLVSTPSIGTTTSWYSQASGGTALDNTTALSSGTYYIEQFSPQSIITLGSGFNLPFGIALQADGKIVVADTLNNAIKRMNADGTNIEILGSGFAYPFGIAVQADGKIVIADTFNNAIKRMNADGTNIEILGSGFANPKAVAIQANGKIIVADTGNNVINRMNADGSGIEILGSGFNFPTGVAVQADGKIIVADNENSAVKRMNSDGTNIGILGSGFSFPQGIFIQADGKIIVADNGNNAVKRMNADGSGIETLGSGFSAPTAVAVQADGKIVVADYGSNSILSITPLYESNRVAVAVTTGATTTWNGSIWDNGVPTSTSKAIIAGNFTAIADLSACSLDITGTAVVSVPTGFNFNISGAVTVSNTASLTFENNANLIQQGTTNTNTGNVVVKRNSSPLMRLDYSLWSSPVASQKLLDFSPATTATRFYTYNTTTNFYNTVASPSTTNFADACGYLVRMPNNHPITPTIWNGVFSGVPNNGTINYTMIDGGVGFRFNLVGNPYPSPINMAQFVTDNTNITGTLYFWRKTNNPISPSYCTWTAGTFTSNGEAQVVDPIGIIQTGQGFFVEANGTGTALTFKNSQRIGNTVGQFFKTKAVERNRIWLNATNTSGAFSQMAVGYITDATQGVDAFDGKYYNDGAIALNSILNNTDYVIQGRALPFDANDVVPMSFSATTAGNYSIAIDHVDGLFLGSQSILLVDKLTGTETDLKAGAYTFTAATGADKTRFSLKYQKNLGINTPVFDENNVTIYKNKGTIQIISTVVTIANVKIFDIQGRLLFEKSKVNAKETCIESSKFSTQVLIVRITGEDNAIVNKKVVN